MTCTRKNILAVFSFLVIVVPAIAFAETPGLISEFLGTPNIVRDAPFSDDGYASGGYYGNGLRYSRLCSNSDCSIFT